MIKLKKAGIAIIVMLLVVGLLPTLSFAGGLPLRVVVNGERVLFPDAEPLVDKSQRVQVPVRFVSEALGAKVGWNGPTKTATVELDKNTIVLTLGKQEYTVNGEKKQMDTAATRIEGRTFVPLRFVSEALGAKVKWDSNVRTVYISTTDVDPGQAEEGNVEKEDMYGFTLYQNTGSDLGISKGNYDEYGKKYALFNLSIRFYHNGKDADYSLQYKEVAEILSQKIDENTVKSIMGHVSKKTNEEQYLEDIKFTDSKYKVYVGSDINSNIVISIFYK